MNPWAALFGLSAALVAGALLFPGDASAASAPLPPFPPPPPPQPPQPQGPTDPNQLSPHFTLQELTRSGTAERYGLPNQPDATALACLRQLAMLLERVRTLVGVPIIINSGYRSPEVNFKVHGSETSQHMKGQAVDANAKGMPAGQFFELLRRSPLPLDQVIYYPPGHPKSRGGHVHFSIAVGRSPRREFRQARMTGSGSDVVQRDPFSVV